MVNSHLNINIAGTKIKPKKIVSQKPRGFNYNSLTSKIGER